MTCECNTLSGYTTMIIHMILRVHAQRPSVAETFVLSSRNWIKQQYYM